jgi:ribokinase
VSGRVEGVIAHDGFDVVVVGSANLDHVVRVRRRPSPGETVAGSSYREHPGGKGVNQAVAAARAGARTAFVGAVGDDDAGRMLRSVLAADGVDTSGLVDVDVTTGRAVIEVDTTGENSIVVVPGANDMAGLGVQVTHDTLRRAGVVLCQFEIPLEAIVAALRATGPNVIKMVVPAPARPEHLGALAGLVDVIVPNQHEFVACGAREGLFATGADRIVVTEGAIGSRLLHRVFDDDVEETFVASFAVDPVDTTGAGDAFAGCLAARLALGASMNEALRAANAAGALAVTVDGAVPSLPRWSAIERLLAGG